MARRPKKSRVLGPVAKAKTATGEYLTSLIEGDAECDTGGASSLNCSEYAFSIKHSKELTDGQRDKIWSLYESNMRELLRDSSLGCNPDEKRSELFHKFARYIIVSASSNMSAIEPIAFATFRFEKEDVRNVLYCYELQVSKSAQGQGFGKILMSQLSKIVKCTNMSGIMLTVLKANTRAVKFYRQLGFVEDSSSPNYDDDTMTSFENEKCDYHIMFLKILSSNRNSS